MPLPKLEDSIYYAKIHIAQLRLKIAQLDRKEEIENEEERKKQSETEKELKKGAAHAVSSGESNLTFKKSKPIKIHSEKNAEKRKRVAVKLIRDEEIRGLREKIGPGGNFPDDSMKRSPQDAQQNFRIQTRGIANTRLKRLIEKTRRGNPKTPLTKEVPFGKDRRPKKNVIGDTKEEEDLTDASLSLDFGDENNPVSRPKKPLRREFTKIISARDKPQIVNPTEPGGRFNPKTPLKKEVPFGKDIRTKRKMSEDAMKRFTQGFDELATGEKIRPGKPSQADRRRIISAKKKLARIEKDLKKSAAKIEERDFGVAKRQRDKAKEREIMEVGEQRRIQQERHDRSRRKLARITKGNTTFDTLAPEDIADIEDIEKNIKPIKGTAGITGSKGIVGNEGIVGKKGIAKPKPPIGVKGIIGTKRKIASLMLTALETPDFGEKNLKDRQDAHTKRITEGLNKGTEKTTPEPFPVGKPTTTSAVDLIRMQRQPKTARNSHIIQWFKSESAYKRASLNDESVFIDPTTGIKYAKYWLLNAKHTNGNGWGVTQQSIAKNISGFVNRPFVITAKQWIANTAYGDVMDHPFVPTNDMNKILAHQETYRVANIIDIHEKNGDYFAIIEVMPKYAHLPLPAFCSPAIYQLDASEHETQISKWSALHLAGLDEDPAYGARIALLRGTCTGGKECIHQLKSAKQLHSRIPFVKGEFETANKLSDVTSQGGRDVERTSPIPDKPRPINKESLERMEKFRNKVSEAGFEGIEQDRQTEDIPLFRELKQRGLVKKISRAKLKLAQTLLPKTLSGQEIVKRFQKVKGRIPKNKGFTFVPETGALIDVTEGRKAGMMLRKELGSPKGEDTFLESNTRDIKNEKDLVPFLDKLEGPRLVGGFVDKKGNFEFDATTAVQGGTKGQSIKRLQKEKQKSGIRLGPEGENEFFDAGSLKKPKLASVIVKERQVGNNMFSDPKGEKTAEQNQRQLNLQQGDNMIECTPCEQRQLNALKAKAKLSKMAQEDEDEEESY